MAQVTPSAPTPDQITDVLGAYGVTLPGGKTAPAAADTTSAPAPDAADVLRSYGVTLPDTGKATPKTDKLPEPKEPPLTKKEELIKAERGMGAQALNALPVVGPLLTMAHAAARARGQGGKGDFSERFGQELYNIRRADEAYAQENPLQATTANLIGSGVGYGGMAKAFPTLAGLVGDTALTRAWAGGVGGGGTSFLDAALRGDDPIEASKIGAIGGAGGPLVAGGVRRGTVNAAERLWPRPGPLQNTPRKAIDKIVEGFLGETPMSVAAARGEMGSAGYLADINPKLRTLAGAIVDKGGEGAETIRNMYLKRAEDQPLRVAQAIDKAMGPDFDIVQHEKFLTESRKKAADPLYEQWRNSVVHPTPELTSLIPRLEKAGAFNMAEELAGISGHNLNREWFTASMNGSKKGEAPTTETWDYVKRGLDRRIDQAYASGDKTLASKLLGLKGEMVDQIEKTDAGKVWKQARSEFADRSALIDNLNRGYDTLIGGRSGVSVDELREELSHLSAPELAARIQGLRKAIADGMGERTNATSSMREKILAPNNQDKMRLMLGKNRADELIKAMNAEHKIAANFPYVIPNPNTGASAVARREGVQNLESPSKLVNWARGIEVTKPATLLPEGTSPWDALESIRGIQASKKYPAIADLLTTKEGPQMNDLVNSIMAESSRRQRIEGASERPTALMSLLMSGPGQYQYRREIENEKAAKRKK